MLEVIDLNFDYQDNPLLNRVIFSLPPGGMLHLRGVNGSGKTTLLQLIAGLYRPAEGEIRFSGQNIHQDLPAYHQQLCFIGHKPGINLSLTLRENYLFDPHYQEGTIDEFASIFKLAPYLDTPCGLLSAGQRRLVALLRLWTSTAKLWLLDEPLVALDDHALGLIISKVDNHREQGGSVLLTSHQKLPLNTRSYQEYCL